LALKSFLTFVPDGGRGVDREPLVGVDHHAEEAGVSLQNINSLSVWIGIYKTTQKRICNHNFRGMYYKTLQILDFWKMDRCLNKLVPFQLSVTKTLVCTNTLAFIFYLIVIKVGAMFVERWVSYSICKGKK
jgi:hypothetical protein